MDLRMTLDELRAFLAAEFPQVAEDFVIEAVGPGTLCLRLKVAERHLRPGGTISGPAMFGLADVAFYLATLALIGPQALAVTTNCAIDFMRKPAPGDLRAEARVLKLGRSLSVGDVMIYAFGEAAPVARAGLTYAIPPRAVPARPLA
jgi:uncharacterized protein (TIGR00369 family)